MPSWGPDLVNKLISYFLLFLIHTANNMSYIKLLKPTITYIQANIKKLIQANTV